MWKQSSEGTARETDHLLSVPEDSDAYDEAPGLLHMLSPKRIHRRLGSAGSSSRRALESMGTSSRRFLESVASNRHLQAVAENVESAVEVVKDAVEEFRHDLIQEAQQVAEVGVQTLQEADNSAMPVLDMALTRTLSILPSDIAQVASKIHGITRSFSLASLEDAPLLQPNEKAAIESPSLPMAADEAASTVPANKIPLVAYLTLGAAVIGLSSSGPILRFQKDCTPLMKMIWRNNGTLMLLCPFLRADIRKNGFPSLSRVEWMNFLMVSVAYASVRICFVQSLEFTTVGNAGKCQTGNLYNEI